jgi:hypothetical protein
MPFESGLVKTKPPKGCNRFNYLIIAEHGAYSDYTVAVLWSVDNKELADACCARFNGWAERYYEQLLAYDEEKDGAEMPEEHCPFYEHFNFSNTSEDYRTRFSVLPVPREPHLTPQMPKETSSPEPPEGW